MAASSEVVMRATDPTFVSGLGLPGASLEGYLFPDTYRLRPHTPAARALITHRPDMSAAEVAREALTVASGIDIYTNDRITLEEL